tara:strand:+ start:425 stop:835 length:411 start_codon:yes stop_codon:yes gene_type:complete
MASTLKINTLTGVTTAGSIAVTGEGNSTTTNLQQGLCKVFYRIATSNSNTVEETFNVSGFTDNGTGDVSITHTNNTVSSPAAVCSHVNTGSFTEEVQNVSNSSSSRIITYNGNVSNSGTFTAVDSTTVYAVFGDLA